MRKTALYLLISGIVLLLLVVPAVALAESMPGMDMGEGSQTGRGAQTAAGEVDHENYKPPEHRADDGTMAAVVSAIFGLPVAGWFVTRSLRKAKKNSK